MHKVRDAECGIDYLVHDASACARHKLRALYHVYLLFELFPILYLSLVMRKPAFCICENKDADQLRSNREADLRPCFCFTDNTIPLLPKSESSSL